MIPATKTSLSCLPLSLALLYLSFHLPLLALPEFWGSSEAREAHVARIIWEEGERIAPLRQGYVPSKPILFHWLAAGVGGSIQKISKTYLDLDIDFSGEFATRTISLFFASGILFCTLLLSYQLASLLGNLYSRTQAKLSLFTTAIILTTTYQFTRLALDARVDMTFSFCVFAALTHVLLKIIASVKEYDSPPSINWTLFYSLCALAVLTKGPLGLALPVLLAGVAYWNIFGFKKAFLAFITPRLGWIFFILLALPWYYFAYLKYGNSFLTTQLFFENIERVTGSEKMNNQPFWFYIPSFFSSSAPWGVFALILYISSLQESKLDLSFHNKLKNKLKNLPLLLLATGILFFSIPSGKRHAYLVPLLPFVAVYLGASGIFSRTGKIFREKISNFDSFFKYIPIFLFLLACLFEIPFFLSAETPVSERALLWVYQYKIHFQIYLLLSSVLVFYFQQIKREKFLSCFISGLVLFSLFLNLGQGIKGSIKNFSQIGSEIRSRLDAGETLTILREKPEEFLDPVLYYTNHQGLIIKPNEFKLPCSGFVLTTGDHYLSFMNANHLSEIARWKLLVDKQEPKYEREIVLARCNMRKPKV